MTYALCKHSLPKLYFMGMWAATNNAYPTFVVLENVPRMCPSSAGADGTVKKT